MSVHRTMLIDKRQFYIDKKAIFEKAIRWFAKLLPDPDEMECDYINDNIIREIRDKTLGYLNFKPDLYLAAFKIFRCMMGHGVEHRIVVDFIIEEIVEAVIDGRWQPRQVGYPGHRLWKEPRTPEGSQYGGFHGRRFRELIRQNKTE